jgi:hypothetical protein
MKALLAGGGGVPAGAGGKHFTQNQNCQNVYLIIKTPNLKLLTLNPQTLYPKSLTLNPKPFTLNPKP